MGTSDPTEEWKRLSALYSEMGDLELLELKDSFADLTDLAQSVLEEELKKRHLWDVPSQLEPSIDAISQGSRQLSVEDLQLGGVTVREYDTLNDARLAGFVLDLAGIPSAVGDGRQNFDLRPVVRVAPQDAEKADAVLAQPIPQQTRDDFEATLNLSDFDVPACPQCGGEDVLLESVEPTNQWICDHCGHTWHDASA